MTVALFPCSILSGLLLGACLVIWAQHAGKRRGERAEAAFRAETEAVALFDRVLNWKIEDFAYGGISREKLMRQFVREIRTILDRPE